MKMITKVHSLRGEQDNEAEYDAEYDAENAEKIGSDTINTGDMGNTVNTVAT